MAVNGRSVKIEMLVEMKNAGSNFKAVGER
jgi:hypothetical protein